MMAQNAMLNNALLELISTWTERKIPIEIAKMAYIISLDFNLQEDIKGVINDIMFMEADDCFILTDNEIENLICKLKNFVSA